MIFSLGFLQQGEIPEVKLRLNRSSRKKLFGKISNSSSVADFIRRVYKRGEIELQEQFIVLYLDRANHVIGYYRHTKGSISGTITDVRIILAAALKSASTSIIIAHNHPSRDPEPSGADLAILARRHELYKHARRRKPQRWPRTTRHWTLLGTVVLNPEPSHRDLQTV